MIANSAIAAVLIGVLSVAVGVAWMTGLLGASYLAGYLAGTRAERPQKPAEAAGEGWGDTPPGPPPDRPGAPAEAVEGVGCGNTPTKPTPSGAWLRQGVQAAGNNAAAGEAQVWLNARQSNLRHALRGMLRD